MRRLFGRVVVEHGKCILKYYLTGSRKEGYSITILQRKKMRHFALNVNK